MRRKIAILDLLICCLLAVLITSCSDNVINNQNNNPSVGENDFVSEDNSPDSYIPDNSNESEYDTSNMPIFNYAPGIYYEAISLELTCGNEYTIRYTTDCSEPTAGSQKYTGPILMQYTSQDDNNSGVTVYNIRAASFDSSGNMIGRVVSNSYIFSQDANRFSTKVISMVTDNSNLYGTTGIIDNPTYRGREWERPVNFQLYDKNGKLEAQQDLGIRTHGTGSRLNVQKNFRLFARREYTEETGHLNANLFPGLVSEYYGTQIEEFDTFLVRGGSTNLHDTMITNLIAYEIMEDSLVDVGNFEPAALFLNGEYYGLMMLIEDYNPYYFESHYGVPEEQVATINFTVVDSGPYAGLNWEPDDCTTEEYNEWAVVRNFLETRDMTVDSNYQIAAKLIDIDNFIQYITYECYLNNWDWPRNNIRIWRYTGAAGMSISNVNGVGGYDPEASYGFDGRWRFVAKDLDISQGVNAYPELGYYAPIYTDFFQVMSKDYGTNNRIYEIFSNLMKNKDFCREFYLYVCEFMSTRVEVDRYLEIINRLSLQIALEMSYHCEKYNDTLKGWEKDIDCMRQFAIQRPAYVLEDINQYSARKYHGYTMVRISLDINDGGSIRYNNATFAKNTLIYSLRNLRLQLEVIPEPGYEIESVTITGGTYKNNYISLADDEGVLTVRFKKIDNYYDTESELRHIVINEIGHSSQEKVNGYDWIELYNPTDKDINIKGYCISKGTKTYTFPSIIVPAGGYKVIFCSGTGHGGVYAPFAISKGDVISIKNPDGTVIDRIQIDLQGSQTHLGRYPDGGEWKEISRYYITPNQPNVFLDGIHHYYGPQICNAIVINGVLIDKSLYDVSQEGVMTTTKSRLSSDVGLDPLEARSLLLLLSSFGEDEVFDVGILLEFQKIKEKLSVYYVPSLNSYMIHY